MNNQYLRYAEKQFTGLTGTGVINWDPFDFSSSPFPSTASFSVLRCTVDIDCVALAVTFDTGATYHTAYSATVVYSWRVSGFVGTIVDKIEYIKNGSPVPASNPFSWTPGSSEMSWAVSNGGGAGALRVTATATSTTNTFNVSMAARIVAYVDY